MDERQQAAGEQAERAAWEAYGAYFTGRTVDDVMGEWDEHRDEWRSCRGDAPCESGS